MAKKTKSSNKSGAAVGILATLFIGVLSGCGKKR